MRFPVFLRQKTVANVSPVGRIERGAIRKRIKTAACAVTTLRIAPE